MLKRIGSSSMRCGTAWSPRQRDKITVTIYQPALGWVCHLLKRLSWLIEGCVVLSAAKDLVQLPAVPMQTGLKRLASGRSEVEPLRVGDRNERCLGDFGVGNTKQFCGFLLEEEMDRRPRGTQAASPSSKHEAPRGREDRAP